MGGVTNNNLCGNYVASEAYVSHVTNVEQSK